MKSYQTTQIGLVGYTSYSSSESTSENASSIITDTSYPITSASTAQSLARSFVSVNNESSGSTSFSASEYTQAIVYSPEFTTVATIATSLTSTGSSSFNSTGGTFASGLTSSVTYTTDGPFGTTSSTDFVSASNTFGTSADQTVIFLTISVTSTFSRTYTTISTSNSNAPYTTGNGVTTGVTTTAATSIYTTLLSQTITNTDWTGIVFTRTSIVTFTDGLIRAWLTAGVNNWSSLTTARVTHFEDGWTSDTFEQSTFFKNEMGFSFTTQGNTSSLGFSEISAGVSPSFSIFIPPQHTFAITVISTNGPLSTFTFSTTVNNTVTLSHTPFSTAIATKTYTYSTTYGFIPYPSTSTRTSTATFLPTITGTSTSTIGQIKIPVSYSSGTLVASFSTFSSWRSYLTTTTTTVGEISLSMLSTYTVSAFVTSMVTFSEIDANNVTQIRTFLTSSSTLSEVGGTGSATYTYGTTTAQGSTRSSWRNSFYIKTNSIMSNTSTNARGSNTTGTFPFHLSALKPVVLHGFRPATAHQQGDPYYSSINVTLANLSLPVHTEFSTTASIGTLTDTTTTTSYSTTAQITYSTIPYPFQSLDQYESVFVFMTYSNTTSLEEDVGAKLSSRILLFTGPETTNSSSGPILMETTIFSFGASISVTRSGLAAFHTTFDGTTYYCVSDLRSTTYTQATTTTDDPSTYSTVRFGTIGTSFSFTFQTGLAGAVTNSSTYTVERIYESSSNHSSTVISGTSTVSISRVWPFGIGGHAPISSLQEILSCVNSIGIVNSKYDTAGVVIGTTTALQSGHQFRGTISTFNTSTVDLSHKQIMDAQVLIRCSTETTDSNILSAVITCSKYLLYDRSDGRPPDTHVVY